MTTTTFDTLGYANQLEEAGFTRKQAEVQANALRDIMDDRLVTREHLDLKLRELDVKLRELEYRLTIRLGTMMAASIAIVAALAKLLGA